MLLISENPHCVYLASEEHRHKGAFVANLSSLSGAAHPYCERVKIYYSEVKRWKQFNKGLPITDIYQRKRGAFFDCSFFFFLEVCWEISRESCREPNPNPNLYTASFQRSLIHPHQNPHLWPVNHRRWSCRVSVCRQTSQRIHCLLFMSIARRMGFIFVYMFVCMVGNDGTPALFLHICLGSSLFRG